MHALHENEHFWLLCCSLVVSVWTMQKQKKKHLTNMHLICNTSLFVDLVFWIHTNTNVTLHFCFASNMLLASTGQINQNYFMQMSSDFRIKLRVTTNESGWSIDNGSTFESPSKNIFCSHNEPPILHQMILLGVWCFWLFFLSTRHLFWARFTHSINSAKCTLFIALNKHFHKMKSSPNDICNLRAGRTSEFIQFGAHFSYK